MWAARNAFLTAGLAGPEGDLYWDYVSALLQFDGSNGSTTITNSSASAAAWTAFGNAQLSTAQSKFGPSSLALDGTADYIQPAAGSTDLVFGTGDFTIELWARFNSLTGAPCVYDWRPLNTSIASPGLFVGLSGGTGKVNYYNGGSAVTTSSATLTTGVWYHLAVSRASGVTRVFINGVLDGTYNDDTNNYAQNKPTFGSLGYDPTLAGYAVDGYLDDIRVTKGVARYTANFDPPTKAFPVVPYTGPLVPLTATGGTVTEADGYRIHTFTSSGTFTVSSLGTDNTLEYLIVAGGGGGGGYLGSGGGAGGVLAGTYSAAVNNFAVAVGAGGAAPGHAGAGGDGGASSVFGLTAVGGGGGVDSYNKPGRSGGSGSGGTTEGGAGGAGTTGQGNNGGAGGYVNYGSGGGGGKTSPGGNGSNEFGGSGGAGLVSSISGSAVEYGCGGGGANYFGDSGPGGGANGGRGGAFRAATGSGSVAPTSGVNGTGSGGGGYCPGNGGTNIAATHPGGSGGSGIVIVRYRIEP